MYVVRSMRYSLLISTVSCLRRLIRTDYITQALVPTGFKLDSTNRKQREDGQRAEGERRRVISSLFPPAWCLVLPGAAAPQDYSASSVGLLQSPRALWASQCSQLPAGSSVETVSLLNALHLCHLSGILSSAGTLTDSEQKNTMIIYHIIKILEIEKKNNFLK